MPIEHDLHDQSVEYSTKDYHRPAGEPEGWDAVTINSLKMLFNQGVA